MVELRLWSLQKVGACVLPVYLIVCLLRVQDNVHLQRAVGCRAVFLVSYLVHNIIACLHSMP